MTSSTTNRYRESTINSTPSKIYDESDTSFTEEYVLDDISKHVCIFNFFWSNTINIFIKGCTSSSLPT